MANTKLYFHKEAREVILKAVNICYEAVRLSLGPAAGSALTYRTYGRGPRIIDDGHAILQTIEPKNVAEKLVVEAFREASEKTNQRAGDGTATTGVLAGKLIKEIFAKLSHSAGSYASTQLNVQQVKRDLLKLSLEVQEKIKAKAKKIETLEDLEKVATISLGNPEVAKTVAKVVWEVGTDGFIDVVDGYKGELETEVVKGARFPAKIGAKAFLNNPKRFEMVAQDCAVVLTNYKLDNEEQARAMFGNIIQKNKKIVVLAPDFSNQVLTDIFQTVFVPSEGGFKRTGYDIWPVKVPSLRTEQFEDLAIFFGAAFINKETGKKLQNITEADLGFVEKLVVKDTENKEDAIALGGRGTIDAKSKSEADGEYKETSKVAERIAMLKSQVEEERIDSHKKLLERRIASLGNAVGVIRVGASTTAESLPLKLKIEDAQYACKSALEEGYVKGGGLCLKEIAEEMGENLLTSMLKSPYEQIQENNESPLEIGDDVIDPCKVVRMAVEHAVSVAANLITVKVLMPEEQEANPADGYFAIASALRVMNAIQAKKEGIKAENMMEMEADWEKIHTLHNGKD